jgi:ABC-type phosphate transport system substrate-binding protein
MCLYGGSTRYFRTSPPDGRFEIEPHVVVTSTQDAPTDLDKIKKWTDPSLTRANRGLRLPDLDIVVVHRAEGSGSYVWTDYLWRRLGNDGVSKLVQEHTGVIGYVELI